MDLFSLGSSFLGGDSSGGLNPFTVFKQFDHDGNGKITEDDFVAAVATLGLGSVGEYAIRAVFKQIDSNGNGKLDMSEAVAGFEKIKSLMPSGQN
ncbi:hypothetical protein BpHYR1_012210 [Brachionus plicatilis]|uniref:EF-hand domain-containing protein n=1 Tax=Brachionus plicatilis TaxID=10195 RepID=A0A3M7REG4_BRAPC|nr:hypothetical protein BpHYR1_012210 [Brachionus plicatilis]